MKGRTYRYFTGPVLHPFGQGLSYTHFDYAAPALSAKTVKAGRPVKVTLTVRNAGLRAGDEVVELYAQKPKTELTARWALAGFTRVHLKAGESRKVTMTVDARGLSQVDAQGNRKVLPGAYTLYVGGGQPGTTETVKANLTVTGTAALPK
jgi:beta-glucosidase